MENKLPKEEPKQVCENCNIEISKYGCACGKQETTLEEVAKNYIYKPQNNDYGDYNSFIEVAKWQQERSYSEEEVLNLLTHFAVNIQKQNKRGQFLIEIKGWFERNKEQFKNK